jgi:hypothetical protein
MYVVTVCLYEMNAVRNFKVPSTAYDAIPAKHVLQTDILEWGIELLLS